MACYGESNRLWFCFIKIVNQSDSAICFSSHDCGCLMFLLHLRENFVAAAVTCTGQISGPLVSQFLQWFTVSAQCYMADPNWQIWLICPSLWPHEMLFFFYIGRHTYFSPSFSFPRYSSQSLKPRKCFLTVCKRKVATLCKVVLQPIWPPSAIV